ncbi:MAG: hypothetical protein JWP66_959 [Naasia sp.]|nr:hypothetical protein [Naasia sp.]
MKALCDRVLVMGVARSSSASRATNSCAATCSPYTKELLAATPTLEVAPADIAAVDIAAEGERGER